MKLNRNYVIKNVLDSDLLIDIKSNFDGVIKLNKSSKDICELVNDGLSREEIIDKLFEKYDIDKDELSKDINGFINDMLEKGIFIDE